MWDIKLSTPFYSLIAIIRQFSYNLEIASWFSLINAIIYFLKTKQLIERSVFLTIIL